MLVAISAVIRYDLGAYWAIKTKDLVLIVKHYLFLANYDFVLFIFVVVVPIYAASLFTIGKHQTLLFRFTSRISQTTFKIEILCAIDLLQAQR
jgi:uncharacterized membrane-anchored protein YitT (DUF2179 family)